MRFDLVFEMLESCVISIPYTAWPNAREDGGCKDGWRDGGSLDKKSWRGR